MYIVTFTFAPEVPAEHTFEEKLEKQSSKIQCALDEFDAAEALVATVAEDAETSRRELAEKMEDLIFALNEKIETLEVELARIKGEKTL